MTARSAIRAHPRRVGIDTGGSRWIRDSHVRHLTLAPPDPPTMVLWWMNALPGNTEPFSMGVVQAHLDGHGSGVDQGVGLAGFHPLGRNAPDLLDEFRGEYLQRGPGGHDAAGIEDDDVVADP